jgi:hypothetical protein
VVAIAELHKSSKSGELRLTTASSLSTSGNSSSRSPANFAAQFPTGGGAELHIDRAKADNSKR